MEPYQQRVIDEHNELSDRIGLLEKFLITDACEKLSAEEKGLLHRQRHVMQQYRGVLVERIEMFNRMLKDRLKNPDGTISK